MGLSRSFHRHPVGIGVVGLVYLLDYLLEGGGLHGLIGPSIPVGRDGFQGFRGQVSSK